MVRVNVSAEVSERLIVDVIQERETVTMNIPQNGDPQVKLPQACKCGFKTYLMVHQVLFQNSSDNPHGKDFKTGSNVNFLQNVSLESQ